MMMFTGRCSVVAVLFFGLLVDSCAAATTTEKITTIQALNIADKLVAAAGHDSVEWSFVQLYDNPENLCLKPLMADPDSVAYIGDMRMILTGRSYYLVMYEPSKEVLFGDTVCIFIDATNGEVLNKEL